jgi:preprotein translocase subunit YajC
MLNVLSQLLLTQTPTPGPTGPMATLVQFVPFVLMFAVVYLLLIRPASKQRKEHQALLNGLQKDDDVVTTGGIVGRIVAIDAKIATLEIADKVKIKVLRDRIEPTQQK